MPADCSTIAAIPAELAAQTAAEWIDSQPRRGAGTTTLFARRADGCLELFCAEQCLVSPDHAARATNLGSCFRARVAVLMIPSSPNEWGPRVIRSTQSPLQALAMDSRPASIGQLVDSTHLRGN
jgi:hypothetical protein